MYVCIMDSAARVDSLEQDEFCWSVMNKIINILETFLS